MATNRKGREKKKTKQFVEVVEGLHGAAITRTPKAPAVSTSVLDSSSRAPIVAMWKVAVARERNTAKIRCKFRKIKLLINKNKSLHPPCPANKGQTRFLEDRKTEKKNKANVQN